MEEEIKKLNIKRTALSDEINLIDDAIGAFQKICKHNMFEDWHDSHYRYYKCSICGIENKV